MLATAPRVLFLGLLVAIGAGLVWAGKEPLLATSEGQCPPAGEQRIVRGNSLDGIIEPGSRVTIFFGYYSCHEVQRGDIVAYRYAANPDPLVKIVKGIPGDRFAVRDGMLSVNGAVVWTSKGEPYRLDDRAARLLSLYERDYRGVIPSNTYLILGNVASGSLDSSRFGLVDRRDLIGKVIPAS